MQYHVEVEPDTVANWGAVPAYREALESTLGPGSLAKIDADAAAHMAGFLDNAKKLYRNFRNAIA